MAYTDIVCRAINNKSVRPAYLVSTILLLLTSPVEATNGLSAIGFGTESLGMGGADLAVARDTSALNTNPAGLIQIPGSRLDLDNTAVFAVNVRHRDNFGNDVGVKNSPIFLGTVGYARHLDNHPVVVGIGLFIQGGAGYEYPELNTAFGTRDELSSLFGILKLSTGVAWRASDALSLGASVALTYARLDQRVFPNTSVSNPDPTQSFFGFELQDMEGFSRGYKLGAQYKLTDRMTLGVAYTGKTKLDLEDGQLVSNFSALGLDRVTYKDVKATGLNLAQEIGLGLAIRATDKLLVSFEVNWLNWSDAVQRSTLTARNPDNPAAPPTLSITASQDWRDQTVIAAGFAYMASDKLILRGGYNYARDPIPDRNLNPVLATIGEHHLTLGMGYQLGRFWRADGAIEYSFNSAVTYTNPALPFGPEATEEDEYVAFHVRLSRQW